ncbi:MAG: ATP-binding cassette domain-containing protein [Hyphomonadaceae bacterium]
MTAPKSEFAFAIEARRGVFRLALAAAAPLDAVTMLFGPSGAGKSLLLSALAGLAPIENGSVRLAGRVLEDRAAGLRTPPHLRGLGLVFQEPRLFPHLSVRGNLEFAATRAPAEKRRLSVAEAIESFEIAGFAERPVRNLSGGEKARVALARALLSAPDLLMLDEPFAALDGARRRAFLALLRDLHARLALPMIVVTHQIEDAAFLGSHMIALKDGAAAFDGPLVKAPLDAAFRALLDSHDVGAALPRAAFSNAGVQSGAAVWLRADSVILATEAPRGISARNVWQGAVAALDGEPSGARLVTVATEAGPLLARVTHEAADELALQPGQTIWAVAKTHGL